MSEGRTRFPLARLLSRLGVASRAEAERLVIRGAVRVHGQVVMDPGRTFGLKDPVEVLGEDGRWRRMEARSAPRYAAFHKPPGVVTTLRDERGRPCVGDLLPPGLAGCFPVGRLDAESEGLLLLTDDGPWADRVSAPGGCAKVYQVRFATIATDDQLAGMARGGALARGQRAAPLEVLRLGPDAVRITLREGKNRQIRRLGAREGLRVVFLQRTAVGEVGLGDLPPGGWRWLERSEVLAFGPNFRLV